MRVGRVFCLRAESPRLPLSTTFGEARERSWQRREGPRDARARERQHRSDSRSEKAEARRVDRTRDDGGLAQLAKHDTPHSGQEWPLMDFQLERARPASPFSNGFGNNMAESACTIRASLASVIYDATLQVASLHSSPRPPFLTRRVLLFFSFSP